MLFHGDGFTLRERRIATVIVRQAFLAVMQVVQFSDTATNDFNSQSPLFAPFLAVEFQNFIKRKHLALAEVLIQFLQTFVDSLPQKCFDALFVRLLDFVDVPEAIAQRALFEGLDAGVGIDNRCHDSSADYL